MRFWQTDFCVLIVRRCRCGSRCRASESGSARASYWHEPAYPIFTVSPLVLSNLVILNLVCVYLVCILNLVCSNEEILVDLRLLSSSVPALVCFNSWGGCGCCCGVMSHLTGENLLQYKLIYVQCTAKVLEYRYPLYSDRHFILKFSLKFQNEISNWKSYCLDANAKAVRVQPPQIRERINNDAWFEASIFARPMSEAWNPKIYFWGILFFLLFFR